MIDLSKAKLEVKARKNYEKSCLNLKRVIILYYPIAYYNPNANMDKFDSVECTFQPNITVYSTSDYFSRNSKEIVESDVWGIKSPTHQRLYQDANHKQQNKEYYRQIKLK